MLKANLRHKKGFFISIVVLMTVISVSVTSIINIKNNYTKGIDDALNQIHASDLTVYLPNNYYSNELFNSVKNNHNVSSAKDSYSVLCDSVTTDGSTREAMWYIRGYSDEYKVINDDLNGYKENAEAPGAGELYITLGIKTDTGIDIGDSLTVNTVGGKYEFSVKGFVVEPVTGCSRVDNKQVFISNGDFEKIYESNLSKETSTASSIIHLIGVNKTQDCSLSDQQFRHQLNMDTGLLNYSVNSMTKSMSLEYSSVVADVLLSIFAVFTVLLIIVVLVFIKYLITTELETGSVNLGILKSLGFTQLHLQIIYVFQYVILLSFGIIIGLALSTPVIDFFGRMFTPITAVLPKNDITVLPSICVFILMILFTIMLIIITVKRLETVSPVTAISSTRKEIYFDSLFLAPIYRKTLTVCISLRNFLTDRKRYISTVAIVAVFVFFINSITLLGNAFNSKPAIVSMGGIYTECDVVFKSEADDATLNNIAKTVEKYSEIEHSYYYCSKMFYLDGEEIHCTIYANPEQIQNVCKGRAPIYDNEIIITEILADEMELNIGDRVTVTKGNKTADYIISGYFNSFINVGYDFAMSLAGASNLGVYAVNCADFSLTDPTQSSKIIDELNNKYSNILEAESGNDKESAYNDYVPITQSLSILIYVLSAILCIAIIRVICSKDFFQKRVDIGIYKSIGFTSKKLQLQFAVCFLIISVIGSVLGIILTLLLSKQLLLSLLKLVGITSLEINFSPLPILLPSVLFCIAFFVFAYFISGKVESVNTKSLIAE